MAFRPPGPFFKTEDGMKIATYVDEAGNAAGLYERGVLRLHDDASGAWVRIAEIPFRIDTSMTLAEVKAALSAAVAGLGECRTLVSGEVRGLVYSLLQEEYGLRVWKARGGPESQLDRIARDDLELAALRRKEAAERSFAALFSSPSGGCGGSGGDFGGGTVRRRPGETLRAVQSMTETVAEGHVRINLAEILAKYRNANSMDVLIPLMEGAAFDKLEILCDHVPRWFHRKLLDLEMRAEIDHSAEGVRALVFPRAQQGGAP